MSRSTDGLVSHDTTPRTLTHEQLLGAIEFDEEISRFRYKARPDTVWGYARFNKKYAGAVAGDERVGGYRTIFILGRRYLEQQIAWYYYYGAWPAAEIEPADGNISNTRKENLRVRGAKQRAKTQKKHSNNSTGYSGVTWNSARKKYLVIIKRGGKQYYGGAFDDVHLAGARARELYKALGFPETHGIEH